MNQAKVTISIWDEADGLAVVAVEFDPPLPQTPQEMTQAQELGHKVLAQMETNPLPNSEVVGSWNNVTGWEDDSD